MRKCFVKQIAFPTNALKFGALLPPLKIAEKYRPWITASLASLIVGMVMLILDLLFPKGGAIWRNWLSEHSTLTYFCEPASIKALFRHKVDTYSNLGFLFVGVLLFAFGKQDQKLSFKASGFAVIHPIWSKSFGIALMLTFAGSTFFHASLTLSGEVFDLAGVYAAALLPGFFNLHRIQSLRMQKHLPAQPFLITWIAFWILSSLLIFTVSSRIVVGSSLFLIGGTGFYLFLNVKAKSGWGYGIGSVILTTIAASFFVMDILKVGCDPKSWFQAHGMWHLMAASASALYYGFMRKLQ